MARIWAAGAAATSGTYGLAGLVVTMLGARLTSAGMRYHRTGISAERA
ncbi:MAG: hypothetical protein ABIW33_01810 [Sphingomicrobium sp.]